MWRLGYHILHQIYSDQIIIPILSMLCHHNLTILVILTCTNIVYIILNSTRDHQIGYVNQDGHSQSLVNQMALFLKTKLFRKVDNLSRHTITVWPCHTRQNLAVLKYHHIIYFLWSISSHIDTLRRWPEISVQIS